MTATMEGASSAEAGYQQSDGGANPGVAANGEGSPLRRQESTAAGRQLYITLGVAQTSTDDEIKRAYRKMALKYHPDKNLNDPTASEKFKEINYANNVLSNPSKRKIYDQYGTAGLKMMETIGEDHFTMYLMQSKWFKWAFLCCGIFSGCFCGCCCCCLCCFNCCCNHCCGKYAPKSEDFDNFDDFMNAQQGGGGAANNGNHATTNDTDPIITQQPTATHSTPPRGASPPPAERPAVIAMPPPPAEPSQPTAPDATNYGSTTPVVNTAV